MGGFAGEKKYVSTSPSPQIRACWFATRHSLARLSLASTRTGWDDVARVYMDDIADNNVVDRDSDTLAIPNGSNFKVVLHVVEPTELLLLLVVVYTASGVGEWKKNKNKNKNKK